MRRQGPRPPPVGAGKGPCCQVFRPWRRSTPRPDHQGWEHDGPGPSRPERFLGTRKRGAKVVMGYGYAGGGSWMWGFGALMMLAIVVLVGLAVRAVDALTKRPERTPMTFGAITHSGGRDHSGPTLDD